MTAKFGRSVILVGAIIAAMPAAALAQDFFREYGTSRSSGGIGPVTASDYSYQDVSPSGLAPLNPQEQEEQTLKERNFAIGPLRFSIAAGVGVEFNDNITYSQDHRESDIVIRPSAAVDVGWRLSDTNVLRFSFGVSYAKYLDHSQYDSDSVLVAPTSALEFTFGLGESVKIALRDRFSYQEDPFEVSVVSNVPTYRRFENQAGVELEWNTNADLRFNLGYDHYNLWTKGGEFFSEQDRAIDTVFLRPSFAISQTVRVGLNTSYSWVNFDSADRDDGYNIMVGPYLEWQITDTTNLFLEAGYQKLTFDGEGYASNQLIDGLVKDRDFNSDQEDFIRDAVRDDDTDTDSYYVRFELNNQPTETFKHRLSGSKTTEIGFFTNSYDLYHIEYSADWKALYKTEVSPTIFYEYYETSGAQGEEASRVGAAVGIRHYLTNSITLGLDYRFIWKDSNLESFDYYQNLAFLSVYYKF